jgi:hypothetical protein
MLVKEALLALNSIGFKTDKKYLIGPKTDVVRLERATALCR